MQVKDYYKILDVSPGATETEIRKSFRRLALRYHPDTNSGERHANAWFREIQEAYDVLTQPRRKAAYLQQRWLLKSTGKRFAEPMPLTPAFIARRFSDFDASVAAMDHFRMDHHAMKNQLITMISDEVIDTMVDYNEPFNTRNAVQSALHSMEPLSFKHLPEPVALLKKMAGKDPKSIKDINEWMQRRRQQAWWEKNQAWIFAACTLLLCGLVYFLTK